MFNRIFKSKKTRILSFLVLIISAAAVVFSIMIPTNRKNSAIGSLGQATINQLDSLSLAIEFYDAKPLYNLSKTPSDNPFYKKLCGLLGAVRQKYSYDRVYILYKGIGGRINYLADGALSETGRPMLDFYPIASQYNQPRYTKVSLRLLENIFDKKASNSYVPAILDGNVIVSYIPLLGEDGSPIAVLGADVRLPQTNFEHFGPFEFKSITTIGSVVFLLSLLLFIASLGLSEPIDDPKKDKYYHSKKNAKKDAILVDHLEDIDPTDYP